MKMSLNEVKDGFDHLKEAVLEKIESKERKQEEITRDVSGTASGGRENQHIFVAGGVETNLVEIFNYRQRLWSLLKPMPGNHRSASSFVYNNHVTVAGGWGRDSGAVDNMIQMNIHPVPDLSINWSDFAAKLPAKLRAHSSVVYKDSLLVTGGINADQHVYSDCIHEVQLKPPYTVKLVSKMPEPRVHHSTVLCDDSILIIGGRESQHYENNLSSVLRYDIKKNECQQLPALPYPVSEMATVKWAENVVIIGGTDKDGKALNNVIIYNIKTGNSHMLPSMLHKRKGCMAVVIENTIVVLGGADERGNFLKSVEGFNFERFSWEELPDMKETRWLATAIVV
ncbi:kelch 3 [Paramuricea clavata]|uniref:Kelch 3 n=1 Tax=Paramuricea clavata TaxID=317549 RepID=A0A6S7G189_PARCT|nr:kelch 3 [Paramuricea clavata]